MSTNSDSEMVVSIHEDFWVAAEDAQKFDEELQDLIAKYRI